MLPSAGLDVQGFSNRLTAAVERLGVRVLIPGTEQDLLAISNSEPILRAAAGVPPRDVVLRVTDKTAVYGLAEQLGFRVPPTEITDRDRLADLDRADFPMILKPVRSARAAHGNLIRVDAQLISSRDELRRLVDGMGAGRWLVQTRVNGQLGAISGVAQNGRVLVAVHQRSHRVWPPGAGVSAFAETVPADHALEAGVARLIGALSWSGIFQAQFIYNDHGPHLIDLNPRVYGSLSLATAAGVNLPAIWAALVTGSPVEPTTYRVGVRYRSDELDIRALLHLVRNRRFSAAAPGMVPRRHTAHSVVTLADPAPGLTSLGKLCGHIRRALRPGPQRLVV